MLMVSSCHHRLAASSLRYDSILSSDLTSGPVSCFCNSPLVRSLVSDLWRTDLETSAPQLARPAVLNVIVVPVVCPERINAVDARALEAAAGKLGLERLVLGPVC